MSQQGTYRIATISLNLTAHYKDLVNQQSFTHGALGRHNQVSGRQVCRRNGAAAQIADSDTEDFMLTRYKFLESRWAGVVLAFAATMSLLMATGCEPGPSQEVQKAIEKGGERSEAKGSARSILDEVAAAYAKAKTYEDIGELYVEVKQGGKTQEMDPNQFSVSFERPNRLRMQAFNSYVVSDGEMLRGVIPGLEQVLTLRTPPALEIGHLLSDTMLTESLSGGLSPTLPSVSITSRRQRTARLCSRC